MFGLRGLKINYKGLNTMTQKMRRIFSNAIRNGEPRFVKYVQDEIGRVLECCNPDDDMDELYPFAGNDSPICYACWRLAVADWMKEPDGVGRPRKYSRCLRVSNRIRPEYNHAAIAKWMELTSRTDEMLAVEIRKQVVTIRNLRTGWLCSRKTVGMVYEIMRKEGYGQLLADPQVMYA